MPHKTVQAKNRRSSSLGLRYETPRSATARGFFNHDILLEFPFFSGRCPRFLETLIAEVDLRVFNPGEIIVQEGDIGEAMYFVVFGTVEVFKKAQKISQLGPGAFFGENALLDVGSWTRTATVRSADFCDCRIVQQRIFNKVLNRYPEEKAFYEKLAMRRVRARGRRPKAKLASSVMVELGAGRGTQLMNFSSADQEGDHEAEAGASEKSPQRPRTLGAASMAEDDELIAAIAEEEEEFPEFAQTPVGKQTSSRFKSTPEQKGGVLDSASTSASGQTSPLDGRKSAEGTHSPCSTPRLESRFGLREVPCEEVVKIPAKLDLSRQRWRSGPPLPNSLRRPVGAVMDVRKKVYSSLQDPATLELQDDLKLFFLGPDSAEVGPEPELRPEAQQSQAASPAEDPASGWNRFLNVCYTNRRPNQTGRWAARRTEWRS
mmetsp:Transcript_1172/g.2372  ORF Transcript_1172/g.2372 Transcript_1172/m.2372 type:complete len:432 (+) Transcript_1172:48-1343(+)